LIPSSVKADEIARILKDGYDDVKLLNDGFRSLVKALKLDYLFIPILACRKRRFSRCHLPCADPDLKILACICLMLSNQSTIWTSGLPAVTELMIGKAKHRP